MPLDQHLPSHIEDKDTVGFVRHINTGGTDDDTRFLSEAMALVCAGVKYSLRNPDNAFNMVYINFAAKNLVPVECDAHTILRFLSYMPGQFLDTTREYNMLGLIHPTHDSIYPGTSKICDLQGQMKRQCQLCCELFDTDDTTEVMCRRAFEEYSVEWLSNADYPQHHDYDQSGRFLCSFCPRCSRIQSRHYVLFLRDDSYKMTGTAVYTPIVGEETNSAYEEEGSENGSEEGSEESYEEENEEEAEKEAEVL